MNTKTEDDIEPVEDDGTGLDIIDLLTSQQLERLEHSRQQAKEGKTKTHEEVMKMSQEWLEKARNKTT